MQKSGGATELIIQKRINSSPLPKHLGLLKILVQKTLDVDTIVIGYYATYKSAKSICKQQTLMIESFDVNWRRGVSLPS